MSGMESSFCADSLRIRLRANSSARITHRRPELAVRARFSSRRSLRRFSSLSFKGGQTSYLWRHCQMVRKWSSPRPNALKNQSCARYGRGYTRYGDGCLIAVAATLVDTAVMSNGISPHRGNPFFGGGEAEIVEENPQTTSCKGSGLHCLYQVHCQEDKRPTFYNFTSQSFLPENFEDQELFSLRIKKS